jgi:MFS family permease
MVVMAFKGLGLPRQLYLFHLALILFCVGSSTRVPVMPRLINVFVENAFLIGLVFSVPLVAGLFIEVPVGALCDKEGKKSLLLLGVFLNGLSFLGFYFSNTLELLIASSVLFGLSYPLAWVSSVSMVMDMSPKDKRGRAFGLNTAVISLGWALGPLIGGYASQTTLSLHTPFLIGALLCFLAVPSLWVFSPKEKEKKFQSVSRKERVKETIQHLKEFVSRMNTQNRVVLLAYVSLFFAYSTRFAFFPLFLSQYNEAELGFIMFSVAIPFVVFDVIMGSVADAWGKKNVLVLGFFLSPIVLFLFVSTSGFWNIVLLAVLLGIAMSFLEPVVYALLTDITSEEERGVAVGIQRLFSDLAFMTAPIVGGVIAMAYGMGAPIVFSGLLMLFTGVVCFLFLKETIA